MVKNIEDVNIFIQGGTLKLIKSIKDICNVTNIYILNECCSFELSNPQIFFLR